MRLVADADVLLSAVIGGRAALALRHDKVEQVFTPVAAYDEVFEYLPSLAEKKRLEIPARLGVRCCQERRQNTPVQSIFSIGSVMPRSSR